MEDNGPVGQLSLPFATSAAGGAAVVASMTRWWLLGPLHGATAMIVAAAVGWLIGKLLTHSLRCDPPTVTARKVLAFIAAAAPLTTLLVAVLCDAREARGNAVLLGLSFAAALLPAAFVIVHLARAAQRSRVRSLLGRSDRRAAWRTTAMWLAIVGVVGSLPAALHDVDVGDLTELFWWSAHEKELLMLAPLLVSVAACALASVVAVLDWRAEHVVMRARAVSAEWRIDEGAGEVAAALDVGVGHDTWMEHVTGRTTYRQNAIERVAAVGDLNEGARLLVEATRRSTIALAIVGAAELITVCAYARVL